MLLFETRSEELGKLIGLQHVQKNGIIYPNKVTQVTIQKMLFFLYEKWLVKMTCEARNRAAVTSHPKRVNISQYFDIFCMDKVKKILRGCFLHVTFVCILLVCYVCMLC